MKTADFNHVSRRSAIKRLAKTGAVMATAGLAVPLHSGCDRNTGIASNNDVFSVKHFKIMIGVLNREVILRFGEDEGAGVLRKGLRHYGNQRGKRIAARVVADGRKLNSLNYLAYAELNAADAVKTEIGELSPRFTVRVVQCPGMIYWRQYNLLKYAKYYCEVVDEALYEGYNPDLKLDITGTMSHGAPHCEFVWDMEAGVFTLLGYTLRKKMVTADAVMPWEYHTGHLYKTLREAVVNRFGPRGIPGTVY